MGSSLLPYIAFEWEEEKVWELDVEAEPMPIEELDRMGLHPHASLALQVLSVFLPGTAYTPQKA